MICEYCGKFFEPETLRGGVKYCSADCRYNADKDRKRMQYVGKRKTHCDFCGVELPKNKTRFCSALCCRKYNDIKRGTIFDHGELIKKCIVCGAEFKTWKSTKLTCSSKCKEENRKQKSNEAARIRYRKNNPDALTLEERNAERHKQKEARLLAEAPERERKEREKEERKAERLKAKAEKERIKQENIAYWQNYKAEHTCVECGKKFIAYYPLKKYCSDTCANRAHRIRKRYDGITVDKGITLKRLAKRDGNICQLCGLFVDWSDFKKTDKTTICGDMYPSIDHITPISLGGLHSWDNVQLAHRGCNTKKCNRFVG